MGKSQNKPDSKTHREFNASRLVSLGFLAAGLWCFGSSLYSRDIIAPALSRMAQDQAQWDEARRTMKRATWLVFGRGIFAARLNRLGGVPEFVSKRPLPEAAQEFEKALDEEKKTAEKVVLVADPSAVAKYGRPCAEYVAHLAALRYQGEGPPDVEALAEIMRYVQDYVRFRFAERYGDRATALLLEYREEKNQNRLTTDRQNDLNERWRKLIQGEIEDFRRLVMINGRNGYVFSGFLFLVSALFLLISIFGRSIIPQEFGPEDQADTKRPKQ